MGISYEKGLEHFQIFEKSVNIDKFIAYCKKLRKKNEHDKIALFMDNLSTHKSNTVLDWLDEHDIPVILSVPYSPDYNPIECSFSKIKHYFKKKRL